MQTRIISHRGFCKTHVENTLPAFEAALALGVDGLELDVHLTADGELIVHHDFDLKRLANSNAYIKNMTLEAIQALDLDGYRIPKLIDVLELIKRTPLPPTFMLNVELKAGGQFYPGIEARVIEECKAHLPYSQYVLSSFDHHALWTIKKLDSKVLTGVLTTAAMIEPWSYVKKLGADFYHPYYLTLTGENYQAMCMENLKVNTYTLNDMGIAKSLIAGNIHAIITDEPEEMLKVRDEVIK